MIILALQAPVKSHGANLIEKTTPGQVALLDPATQIVFEGIEFAFALGRSEDRRPLCRQHLAHGVS